MTTTEARPAAGPLTPVTPMTLEGREALALYLEQINRNVAAMRAHVAELEALHALEQELLREAQASQG